MSKNSRDTYHSEERAKVNAPRPPDPPKPTLTEKAAWETNACDPYVIEEIKKLAFGDAQKVRANLLKLESDERIAESKAKTEPIGPRNWDGIQRTRTRPDRPCPMHAWPPRVAGPWNFVGIEAYVDKAAERHGLNVAPDSATCISKCKRFTLVGEVGGQLSFAAQSGDPAAAKRHLKHASMVRQALAAMLDGVDSAIAETRLALGLGE